ncbi:MAG: hypothetical protein WAU38_13930 [Ignavibacteria bacterium]
MKTSSKKKKKISAKNLSSVRETAYLLSIPGMKESILKGKRKPFENCLKKLTW